MQRIKFLLLVILMLVQPLAHAATAATEPPGQKAILVTGASSGIGRNITETLARQGHFVYAGARKDNDLAELDAIENVMAVRLDVTSQEQVDAAAELIAREGRGLYGLVNNAGVAVYGPLTTARLSDLDFVMGVNVAGVLRVTQAFVPMILASHGRITTIGSIAGFRSGPTGGIYSMSKHAVEAFTDSLAAELEPMGIAVSVVEPGNFKSKIRRTTVGREVERLKSAGQQPGEEVAKRVAQVTARELQLAEPDAVSAAVADALFAATPRRRYLVVPNQREAQATIGKVIEVLVQLNQGQAYSYDRAELVKMLDEALANQ